MVRAASHVRRLLGLSLAVVYLSIPAWMRGVDPALYQPAFSDTEETREERNASAAARLFGQFRVGVSDILFVKTEEYLHGGVAYAPHMDIRTMSQTGDIAASHAGHPHAPTLIPPPEEDWRGYIGNLEREVSPWLHPSEEHHLTTGKELLPYYWLAVRANPHNVRAYRIGTFWLASLRTEQAIGEALRFIDEGVRNNPGNFMLYEERGAVERRMGKPEAAMASFQQAIRLGMSQRPAEGASSPLWDDDREEELESSLRYAVYTLEEMGRYKDALETVDFADRVFHIGATLAHVKTRLQGELAGKAPGANREALSKEIEEMDKARTEHRHHDEDKGGQDGESQPARRPATSGNESSASGSRR